MNVPVSTVWRASPAHTSRWRRASSTPSPTPSAASGGEPKWSSSRRMLPGSRVIWSATGGSQSTTPTPSDTTTAFHGKSGSDEESPPFVAPDPLENHQRTTTAPRPSTTIPTPRGR